MIRNALCAAVVGVFSASLCQGAPWVQFQCDPAHTGRSAGPAVQPPYKLRWIWYGPGNRVHTAGRNMPIGAHAPRPPKDNHAKLSFTLQAVAADGVSSVRW